MRQHHLARISRVGHFDDALEEPQHKRHEEYSIDGLNAEADAHLLDGPDEQHAVYDDIRHLYFHPCGIVDDGGHTCHASSRETVRQHEHRDAQSIKGYTHRYEGVVLQFVEYVGLSHRILML